jgi:hypothetical protein
MVILFKKEAITNLDIKIQNYNLEIAPLFRTKIINQNQNDLDHSMRFVKVIMWYDNRVWLLTEGCQSYRHLR